MYEIQQYKTLGLPFDYYVSLEGQKITNETRTYEAAEFMLRVCEEYQVTKYSSFNDLLKIDREGGVA